MGNNSSIVYPFTILYPPSSIQYFTELEKLRGVQVQENYILIAYHIIKLRLAFVVYFGRRGDAAVVAVLYRIKLYIYNVFL